MITLFKSITSIVSFLIFGNLASANVSDSDLRKLIHNFELNPSSENQTELISNLMSALQQRGLTKLAKRLTSCLTHKVVEELWLDDLDFKKTESSDENPVLSSTFYFISFYCNDLKTLHLERNGISVIPKEIGRLSTLSKLTRISLSLNSLRSLPSEIVELSQISELDVSYNYLTALPIEIGKLSKLTHLNLRHNHLDQIPEELEKLGSLTYLNLESNKLTCVHPRVSQMNGLKSLVLKGNSIRVLPYWYYDSTPGFFVDVENNPLVEIEDILDHPKLQKMRYSDLISTMSLTYQTALKIRTTPRLYQMLTPNPDIAAMVNLSEPTRPWKSTLRGRVFSWYSQSNKIVPGQYGCSKQDMQFDESTQHEIEFTSQELLEIENRDKFSNFHLYFIPAFTVNSQTLRAK